MEGLFELAIGEKIKTRHPYILCLRYIENNNVQQTLSKVDMGQRISSNSIVQDHR